MGSDERELSQRRAELQAEAATLLHRLGDYQAAVVELEQSLAVLKDNAQVGARPGGLLWLLLGTAVVLEHSWQSVCVMHEVFWHSVCW